LSFPSLFLETQINQDLRHYVNENVMVKSGRMADMLGLVLREAYLDTEVTDFLVSLDFSLKRSGDLWDHLRGKIKTKFLHRKAMEGILPQEILSKPKQGGFVPVMIFLRDSNVRKRIYQHLLHSEIILGLFKQEYLTNLFEKYEGLLEKKMYWHNFLNAQANRILFLLTFDIWHNLYLSKGEINGAKMSLSDYLSSQSGA
jgi:asparagine synthase (glutamine-hydrolysing)